MLPLDPRADDESTADLLDTALPAVLLVAVASWLPAGVLLVGYAVRVLRAELAGDDRLPSLDDVRGLGWTGLRGAVLVAAFQLPALCCLGGVFALWYAVDGGRVYGDALGLALGDPLGFVELTVASSGSSPVVVAGLVLTAVLAVVANYVGTVAVVAFAATDRLSVAFDSRTLGAGVRSSGFRRAFLLGSLVSVIGSGVARLLALVTLVGPFVGAVVELVVLVGVLRIVADGYDGYVVHPVPGRSAGGDRASPGAGDTAA
jgi:hypothetical protein